MRLLTAIVLLVSALVSTDAEARYLKKPVEQPVPLDTAIMEIIYLHKAYDPKKNKAEYSDEMLTIGPKYHHYGNYGNYQFDSIARENPYLDGIAESFDDYYRFSRKLKTSSNELSTNIEENSVTYFGYYFMNNYRYTEIRPEIEWELVDETQEIMNHECKKATAKWRGRVWTAWYSDLPFDAGPWKFNGLPGVILKIEDSEGHHVIEAVEIKDDPYVFGYHKRLHTKTTREKYNAGYEEYCLNAGKMFLDSGMVSGKTEEEAKEYRTRTLFYSPIELE